MAGSRQAILEALLLDKSGLTIDELSNRLDVSRNATQQHITALERDGLVAPAGQRNTGGRPSRVFVLTDDGYETFPRRYDLLSQEMLKAAKEMFGEAGVAALMQRMAQQLEVQLAPRLDGASESERLDAVLEVLNRLGYQASPTADGNGISAVNCIYHHLAQETRAVCKFDRDLLSRLLGSEVEHMSCMLDGARACVFHRGHTKPEERHKDL